MSGDTETTTHFSNVADIIEPDQEKGITNPTAIEIIGVTFLRMYHLSLVQDSVLVPSAVPKDFSAYMQQVLGFTPNLIPTELRMPHLTSDLLRALNSQSPEGLGRLNPYIQSPTIAQYAIDRGLPMAYTPAEVIVDQGLMRLLDDKRYFRKTVMELGHPMLPQREYNITSSEDDASALSRIEETIKEHGGAFVQTNRSGGGEGNLDIKYVSETDTWRSAKLAEHGEEYAVFNSWEDAKGGISMFIAEGRELGSDYLLVTPYFDEIEDTPTVNGFVPPIGQGEPVIYGRFAQVVQPGSNAYLGFEYDANADHIISDQELYCRTMAWFKHIQQLGYVGCADIDFVLGKIDGRVFETSSESNVRMDAMRFALQHAAWMNDVQDLRSLSDSRIAALPAIRAIDHIHTRADSTEAILELTRRGGVPLLGHNGTTGFSRDGGILIMTPPKNGVFAAAAIGQHIGEVRQWMTNLGELTG